jgi:hypothetical protein
MLAGWAARLSLGDKILLGAAVALAAPPLLIFWSSTVQAKDPHPNFWLVFAIVILGVPGAFAWACRRTWLSLLIAPIAVLVILIGITSLCAGIGSHKVLDFCQNVLRSPTSVQTDVTDLEALAATFEPECRIRDLTWGLWEVDVYSRGQRVGIIGILPQEPGGFEISYAGRIP